MKFNIPPGVFDLTPINEKEKWKSSYLWAHIEKVIRETTATYSYHEIRTPLFERTELFQRSVGEQSDIVSKEMYTFLDKGGRSMSLRPEGTAPVMRAFIENRLDSLSSCHKLFYIAPMFRYERSQAGRYRQHHQFGVEAIGNGSAEQDAEVIDLLFTFYNRLGLQNLRLCINSLGNSETRSTYKEALKSYLKPYFETLSEESKTRFETNPLRILDSKDPKDQEIVQNAPVILDFLVAEDRWHFNEVQRLLTLLKIPYEINSSLVRGLDYYNKTVFEVVSGELGAQNSIGGGGRYDGLISELSGPDLPSFGFGTGIERVIQTMINQQVNLPQPGFPMIYFIPLGEEAKTICFEFLHALRLRGIPSQMDFVGKKIGKSMQQADQLQAGYAVVVGENEIEKQVFQIKKMKTSEVNFIEFEQFVSKIEQMYLGRKVAH